MKNVWLKNRLQVNYFEELYYGLIKLAKYTSLININTCNIKPMTTGMLKRLISLKPSLYMKSSRLSTNGVRYERC